MLEIVKKFFYRFFFLNTEKPNIIQKNPYDDIPKLDYEEYLREYLPKQFDPSFNFKILNISYSYSLGTEEGDPLQKEIADDAIDVHFFTAKDSDGWLSILDYIQNLIKKSHKAYPNVITKAEILSKYKIIAFFIFGLNPTRAYIQTALYEIKRRTNEKSS